MAPSVQPNGRREIIDHSGWASRARAVSPFKREAGPCIPLLKGGSSAYVSVDDHPLVYEDRAVGVRRGRRQAPGLKRHCSRGRRKTEPKTAIKAKSFPVSRPH